MVSERLNDREQRRMLKWLEITTTNWPRGVTLQAHELRIVQPFIKAGLVEQGDAGENFWRITTAGREALAGGGRINA